MSLTLSGRQTVLSGPFFPGRSFLEQVTQSMPRKFTSGPAPLVHVTGTKGTYHTHTTHTLSARQHARSLDVLCSAPRTRSAPCAARCGSGSVCLPLSGKCPGIMHEVCTLFMHKSHAQAPVRWTFSPGARQGPIRKTFETHSHDFKKYSDPGHPWRLHAPQR